MQKTKAPRISTVLIILIISMLFLGAFIIALVYEFIIIPDMEEVRIDEGNSQSMRIATTCSSIMETWCQLNESKRDEIRLRLDESLDLIKEKYDIK